MPTVVTAHVAWEGQSPAIEITRLAPDPWDEVFTKLDAIRNLTDDWDGEGALAPAPEVVASATEWAQYLRRGKQAPPAGVMAGPNGTILFNWQDENGYRDAEVTRPHYVEWMHMVPGRPTQHGAFDFGEEWRPVAQGQQVIGPANMAPMPVPLADRAAIAVTSLYNAVKRLTPWTWTGPSRSL